MIHISKASLWLQLNYIFKIETKIWRYLNFNYIQYHIHKIKLCTVSCFVYKPWSFIWILLPIIPTLSCCSAQTAWQTNAKMTTNNRDLPCRETRQLGIIVRRYKNPTHWQWGFSFRGLKKLQNNNLSPLYLEISKEFF